MNNFLFNAGKYLTFCAKDFMPLLSAILTLAIPLTICDLPSSGETKSLFLSSTIKLTFLSFLQVKCLDASKSKNQPLHLHYVKEPSMQTFNMVFLSFIFFLMEYIIVLFLAIILHLPKFMTIEVVGSQNHRLEIQELATSPIGLPNQFLPTNKNDFNSPALQAWPHLGG